MTENIEIVASQTLSNGFFTLKSYTFKTASVPSQQLSREVYHSKNGATALLYNRQRSTVILIRQFRLPTYLNQNTSGLMLETCAGLVEENEDPKDTIIREIEEETGYRVEKISSLFSLYSTPGAVAEKLHYYVAEYSAEHKTGDGGGLAHEDEDIEVIELPFEEAYNKIMSGEIVDAKTVILLQYARLNIFLGEKVFQLL